SGPSRWELHWSSGQEMAPDVRYRIEERQLALDPNDELQVSWREIAASKITATHDRVIAEVGQLNPHQLHMLRVTALDADDAPLWESPLVALAPSPSRSHARAYLLSFLIAGLAGLFYWRWQANRAE
ncbi:MAG: hypothetical protein ACREP1_05400, partial [Rhodanobacteraceae bacterium]